MKENIILDKDDSLCIETKLGFINISNDGKVKVNSIDYIVGKIKEIYSEDVVEFTVKSISYKGLDFSLPSKYQWIKVGHSVEDYTQLTEMFNKLREYFLNKGGHDVDFVLDVSKADNYGKAIHLAKLEFAFGGSGSIIMELNTGNENIRLDSLSAEF